MVLSQREGRRGRKRGERRRVEIGDGEIEPGEEIGEKQEKDRLRRKLTGKRGRAVVGLCRREKKKGERNNTEMKENMVSQNMREKAPQK